MLYKKLSNDVSVPMLGLGTWKMKPEVSAESVSFALKNGYRHIDTAAIYGNEKEVGEGIRLSKIPREELFITTKLWNADQGYDSTLHAIDVSLKKLGLSYVDLYLIHWPKKNSVESWKAMEEIYRAKKARAIGVSNFTEEYLELITNDSTINPMVNQVERHPYYVQKELTDYCNNHHIALEAYTPLAQGDVFKEPSLQVIADKYNKTISQVVLRWELQTGFITFPKSTHPERIIENFDIFDFTLSNEDIAVIEALDCGRKYGALPADTYELDQF